MKNEKVTKKVVIELNGVDTSQACELFYHFHNAFAGSIIRTTVLLYGRIMNR